MKFEHSLEIASILLTILFFVYEIRTANTDERTVLWVLLVVVAVLIVLFILANYIKTKIDLIDRNATGISRLKEELSVRKSFEDVYYKLGKLERRR